MHPFVLNLYGLAQSQRLLVQEHTFDNAATDAYESVIDPRGARWGGAMACLKPTSSLEALETGGFHRVPVMIGATEQDGLGIGLHHCTVLCASV